MKEKGTRGSVTKIHGTKRNVKDLVLHSEFRYTHRTVNPHAY
jgi:hypothetical protein